MFSPTRGFVRVGVNALYLIPGGVGGTEIYLRALLPALAKIDPVNTYYIFTNRETGPDLVPAAPNFIYAPQPIHAALRPARILWEQTVLPLAVLRLRLDVMLNPGFTAPLLCPCPQVTVFHDLQHKRHPENFRWFDRPFWRFFLYWAARRSKALIAISETTAADLRRFYPHLSESKIHIVPQGVDPVFARIRSRRRPEPFLLAVSTLHPHKNLDGLLRAFALFRRRRPDFRLVVCGMHGLFAGPLHDLRQSLGLEEAVEFPDWIPREQLYDLYARAWAFVYPSRFEGFGLPIPEAMAAGIPMACSDVEPMAGLAGDAAVKFDPDDVEAMAAAMLRITEDETLRAHLAEAGPRQAAKYSWVATAKGTLAAIIEASRA
jgi:glycosyltransferase involved in cell wall biosynthesis